MYFCECFPKNQFKTADEKEAFNCAACEKQFWQGVPKKGETDWVCIEFDSLLSGYEEPIQLWHSSGGKPDTKK